MLTIKNLKKKSFFMLLAGLLTLLSIGTSFAAGADGSSPDNALTPGTSQTLNGGESVWYAFNYQLDTDGTSPRINISLDGYPDTGTNFEVWTADLLQQWQQSGDDEVSPVGRGSQNDYVAGDYSWTGEFIKAGTYYVRVTNQTATPNTHFLSVTGKSVTLPQISSSEKNDDEAKDEAKDEAAPASGADMPASSEAEASVESSEKAEVDATNGSSPENALNANGLWKELEAGTSVWYAFSYSYDSGDPVKASVWMNSEPDNGINFEVWTAERLQEWQNQDSDSNKAQPVGRGSQEDSTPGDYFWTGTLYQSGTVYVRVTNDNSTASFYQLHTSSGN